MIDLVLVNPGGRDRTYQGLGDSLTAVEPPLWCRLIAGFCRDRGWTVQIVDAEAMQLTPFAVANYVLEVRPRLCVVVAYGHQPSASTQQMVDALLILGAIKKHTPEQQTAICGGHVSALPERTAEEAPGTHVIVGEGPLAIDRLLSGEETGGEPLLPFSALHGQVWDLLPMTRYRAHNWQCFDGSPRAPYASIVTSLGCPYQCVFCCINAPFGGPNYRTRDPDEVVDEVEYLYREHGVSTFKIVDEMFVLKRSHYLPICEGLAALPFADELNIWAYARVDTIRESEMAVLRAAGIRWLALGIESGSAHVRDGAEKSLDEDDIFAAVRGIQAADINVIGNYIFGLPDDTMASMQETFTLALSLRCEFANFYSAMAYPGSVLYATTSPQALPDKWSGYSQHSFDCTPLPTKVLSSAQVLTFRDRAHVQYFSDSNYQKHVGECFGNAALRQIERGLRTRLPRQVA